MSECCCKVECFLTESIRFDCFVNCSIEAKRGGSLDKDVYLRPGLFPLPEEKTNLDRIFTYLTTPIKHFVSTLLDPTIIEL